MKYKGSLLREGKSIFQGSFNMEGSEGDFFIEAPFLDIFVSATLQLNLEAGSGEVVVTKGSTFAHDLHMVVFCCIGDWYKGNH